MEDDWESMLLAHPIVLFPLVEIVSVGSGGELIWEGFVRGE